MECNREEAIRSKTIAEGKLVERDYAGAKKFALKAQNLYPGLEGLSQMFAILDVYISSENKISGEVDWYGILGVNPSDDDETIRKQYRKLALLLHPDKNKSVGADGAFKLLSEAWSLLSDKVKRLAYNQRRSSRGFQQKPPSAAPRANGFHNFTSRPPSKPMTPKNSAGPPPQSFRRSDTFWTICHQCNMHYEYLRMYLNHTLLCPNCRKAFLATEMGPPPVNMSKPSNPSFRQQHQNSSNSFDPGRNAAAAQNTKPANIRGVPFSRMGGSASTGPTVGARTAASVVFQKVNEKLKRAHEDFVKAEGPAKKSRGLNDHGHVHGGRFPYQMAMGNGNVGPGSVSGLRKGGFEADRVHGFPGNFSSRPNNTRELSHLETRNMLMWKARVEIRKKLNEWREEDKSKSAEKEKEKVTERKEEKGKYTKPSATKRADKISLPQRVMSLLKEQEKKQEGSFSTSTSAHDNTSAKEPEPEPISMNVPDPDFHDFDLDRTESSFGDNQVWAAYDDDDGMPRFYAMIHNVISKKPFKMKISWLNSKSNSEFGPLSWVGSGFYKTSGEFWVGRHEINKSINSFSHKVKWAKAARGSILIFPKKGEVWALYRNWANDWNEQTPDEVIHKYDMVEVLDDYNEDQGISVTPLDKVAGFKTVFRTRASPDKAKRIPKEEMFRFSHQVPNYMLTGQEAQNAPKGCLELDPAATPLDLLQVITETKDEIRVDESVDGAEKAKEEERVEYGEKNRERQ